MLNVALFDLLRVMKCDESVSVDHFFVSQLFLSYFRELFMRVASLFFLDFSPQVVFSRAKQFQGARPFQASYPATWERQG